MAELCQLPSILLYFQAENLTSIFSLQALPFLERRTEKILAKFAEKLCGAIFPFILESFLVILFSYFATLQNFVT
jgi:hypothetical protein